jgi:hypothetical protein
MGSLQVLSHELALPERGPGVYHTTSPNKTNGEPQRVVSSNRPDS